MLLGPVVDVRAAMLVEAPSDRAALEKTAEWHGRDLAAERIAAASGVTPASSSRPSISTACRRISETGSARRA